MGNVPLHTDDNMAVEYLSGRALSRSLTTYFNFISLLKHRTPVRDYLVNLEGSGESREEIDKILERYWTATTWNLEGQRLIREGRRDEAFKQFNRIPAINFEDREPVEYFGAPYQRPFLQNAEIIMN